MPLIIIGAVAVLLILLQNYAYKRLWKKGLDFSVNFSAKEAFEGDSLFLVETLTNKKSLPLPWVYARMQAPRHLEFTGPDTEAKDGILSSLYSIMFYTATRRKKAFVCKKRGVYKVHGLYISVSNLLHTEQFSKELSLKNELLVFPKILDDFGEITLLYRHLDSAVVTNRVINPDPFEFKGIRDYLPGDALKFVNFRASAISQKLMVNIHAPTCAQRIILVLNADPCENQPYTDAHEQAIRLCATLAEHYIGMEIGVGFSTNARDSSHGKPISLSVGTSSGHLYKIFECLARVSLSFKCPPMTEYINQLTDKEQMYVFISSHHDEAFLNAFEELQERSVATFLIVPTFKRMNINVAESQNITLWDSGV
ncbi:MAG: DUF58 domain-containing protein [Defluviitaleaceae bacterium]|nr:DUF58 domain-containing protein [Defluviitaleaceae bacterium]